MKQAFLTHVLPSKFLYLIPLYVGVELILSFAILNKAGGVYGVLSILTGHHMNFWQWLYNLSSFFILPFYISALFSMSNRSTNLRKMCLSCSIYIFDTLWGLLYTIYFVHFWFSREDTNSTGRASSAQKQLDNAGAAISGSTSSAVNSAQSASPGRELFLTVSGTFLTTAIRVYFCLVFVSFTKRLLVQSMRNQKFHGHDSIGEEAVHSSLLGKIKKFVYGLEMRAKHFFIDVLIEPSSEN